jgi:ABC-type bacteriocin/lantibiotic exporter with double-glycine peptidase domain
VPHFARGECGIACIQALIRLRGIPVSVSLDELRSLAAPNGARLSMQQMLNIFQELGLNARAVFADRVDLLSLRLPCIAHLKGNHFVVMVCINRTHALILDPAHNNRIELVRTDYLSRRLSFYMIEVAQ